MQVNLDFSSEADMIRKFRAGLALQPVSNIDIFIHFIAEVFQCCKM